MIVSLVAAVAKGNVIGHCGRMPWKRIPTDLRYFRERTAGNPVLMGRKTFESVLGDYGKPLPMRRNIVITRQPNYQYAGIEVVGSLGGAFTLVKGVREACVIGGGEIYREAFPYALYLYITHIDLEAPGDTFFPYISPTDWEVAGKLALMKGDSSPYDLAFTTYKRKTRAKELPS